MLQVLFLTQPIRNTSLCRNPTVLMFFHIKREDKYTEPAVTFVCALSVLPAEMFKIRRQDLLAANCSIGPKITTEANLAFLFCELWSLYPKVEREKEGSCLVLDGCA